MTRTRPNFGISPDICIGTGVEGGLFVRTGEGDMHLAGKEDREPLTRRNSKFILEHRQNSSFRGKEEENMSPFPSHRLENRKSYQSYPSQGSIFKYRA